MIFSNSIILENKKDSFSIEMNALKKTQKDNLSNGESLSFVKRKIWNKLVYTCKSNTLRRPIFS